MAYALQDAKSGIDSKCFYYFVKLYPLDQHLAHLAQKT